MREDIYKFSQVLAESAPSLPPQIMERGTPQRWKAKDVILANGTRLNKLYYVAEGRVCLSLLHEEGGRRLLYFAEAGHFIGEAHFFYTSMNIGDFHAITPCRTVYFGKSTVEDLLEHSAEFRQALLRGLSYKALLYGTEILNMSYGSSPERLLSLLQHLAVNNEIQATQAEIAAMLGVHKVTINRLLRNLEQEQALKVCRSKIILL